MEGQTKELIEKLKDKLKKEDNLILLNYIECLESKVKNYKETTSYLIEKNNILTEQLEEEKGHSLYIKYLLTNVMEHLDHD